MTRPDEVGVMLSGEGSLDSSPVLSDHRGASLVASPASLGRPRVIPVLLTGPRNSASSQILALLRLYGDKLGRHVALSHRPSVAQIIASAQAAQARFSPSRGPDYGSLGFRRSSSGTDTEQRHDIGERVAQAQRASARHARSEDSRSRGGC